MTSRQKQVAFRCVGYLCWVTVLGLWAAGRWLVVAGAALGTLAVLMAVAEVMARADEKVTSDVERFKQNMELIRAVAAGLKPNPPGVEFIREGGEPVERS